MAEMFESIRIMIIDDSSVVRRAVTEALSHDPDISIVGTASNGKIALFQDVAVQWLRKISSDMSNVRSRIKRLNRSLSVKGIEKGRQALQNDADKDERSLKTGKRFPIADKMAQPDVDKLLKEYGL